MVRFLDYSNLEKYKKKLAETNGGSKNQEVQSIFCNNYIDGDQ